MDTGRGDDEPYGEDAVNWTPSEYNRFRGRGQQDAVEVNRRHAVPRRGVANKWERRFRDEVLEPQRLIGEILWYAFEDVKFRLATGAWYTPDWVARSIEGGMIAYEVKGHWREAARVRIKVAAENHPLESGWRFIAVTRDKKTGEWAYEHIKPGDKFMSAGNWQARSGNR